MFNEQTFQQLLAHGRIPRLTDKEKTINIHAVKTKVIDAVTLWLQRRL